MPKKTFLNLPQKRRNEILDACYEEFALNTYSLASLSNIIKKLGIAKGSFYRYFSSKKELYMYLLKISTEKRLANADSLLKSEKISLYDKLVENFRMKVRFDLQYPLISGFLYNVLKEKNNDEIGDAEQMIKDEIHGMVKDILAIHIRNGELRNDIDEDCIAFMIMQVQISIYDYLEKRYNIDFRESILERKPIFSVPEDDILIIVKSFAKLLERGYIKY